MFAFIGGLGLPELIVLLVVAVMFIGGPVLAVVLAVSLSRRSGRAGDARAIAELRAEVERLRAEVERLKKASE